GGGGRARGRARARAGARGGAGGWTALHNGARGSGSQDGASGSAPPGTGTSPPASAPASGGSSAPAGDGRLPARYVGTWKGTITTRIAPLPSTFEVRFTAGRVGEAVGRTANASAFDDTVCHGVLTLLSVDADRIELQEEPTGRESGCTGAPERQTYTADGHGVLHLQVSGAPLGSDPSGDLAKQG
ncbi:hypothetical protein ACFV0G_02665, partial [Kitasatospora sp. NPDC059571]